MREILFRGKRVDNGEWIYWDRYGRITDINGEPTKTEIDIPPLLPYPTYIADLPIINDETVGDYTGLKDKDGRRIFEGDIVKYNLWDDKFDYCEVKFGYFYAAMDSYNGGPALGFYLADINGKADDIGFFENLYKFVEVIGTIYDNPELLEVEEWQTSTT